MSCGEVYGCGVIDPRLPERPPIRLNHHSNMSSSGATIQNGRIQRRRRRRQFFSFELHRISEVAQHPALVTFREVCVTVLVLYALFRFPALAGRRIRELIWEQEVQVLCFGRSFAGCGWGLLWNVGYLVGGWLKEVVAWGLVCVLVVFFGEEVLRRKG